MQNNIYVTKSYLPPLEDFTPYLEQIWDSRVLTNNGPLHTQLEEQLSEYLGVPEVALFNNGTIALVTALKALRIKGDVITTPFSFVATSHSLVWNDLTPVFVDIDPITLNLDPQKIEDAITPKTTAIMPVHCYGNPCDVNAIQQIADKYNLKVIYDAAHAFGVKDHGGSVLRHGDLSILSLHATKVFNTFEGGAIICPDKKTKSYINKLKNFGIVDEVTVEVAGINGKMSELNAAIGLLQLQHVDNMLNGRKQVAASYNTGLTPIKGISIVRDVGQVVSNHSYYPILVTDDYPLTRDELYTQLKEYKIFTRKYFYPLISEFPVYKSLPSSSADNLPVATKKANQILCLPIYPDLDISIVEHICSIIAHLSIK